MKRVILLFIGVVGFAGILFAQERDAVVGTSLMDISQGQPVAQPGFQWQASVAGIRKTAEGLLEINQKVAQEYTALKEEAAGLQAEIDQINQQNKTLQDAIVARQMELSAPVKVAPVRDDLVLTRQVIAQEKQSASVLKVKLRNMDSRANLLQLKIKELELEKRTFLVDQKTRSASSDFDGKTELNRLKASLESLRGQEEDLQEKIADARSRMPVRTEEDEKIIRETGALKADLAILQQEKADLNRRLKERAALMNSLSFKRYLELVGRREALTKKTEDLKKQKGSAEDRVAKAPIVPVRDWEADIKSLNTENTKIEEQTGDLRENIAVLEYKINNLSRYKDRNKFGN